MKENLKNLLKSQIDSMSLISFEVFGTLLFDIVKDREVIWSLAESRFQIHGLPRLRKVADRLAKGDVEEAYAILSRAGGDMDWEAVKSFELGAVRDGLVPNRELKEIIAHALARGKRVVAVCEEGFGGLLRETLAEKGFGAITTVYTREDAAEGDVFDRMSEREGVPRGEILHIGRSAAEDVKTLDCIERVELSPAAESAGTDIDAGIYRFLAGNEQSFWYRLGALAGGPLYMGLSQFVKEKQGGKKLAFLMPGGEHLYNIFERLGLSDIRKISREELFAPDFLACESLVFEAGWDGSTQAELEALKKYRGIKTEHRFIYAGICNTEEARKNVCGVHYDAFLFDFYRNFSLGDDVGNNLKTYGLLFGGAGEANSEIFRGIWEFMEQAAVFTLKYGVEYPPHIALEGLKRFIHEPTAEEALLVGRLVDPETKRELSGLTWEEFSADPGIDIFWAEGLLYRPDIPEDLKIAWASYRGIAYPKKESPYRLEEEPALVAYARWRKLKAEEVYEEKELPYKPFFSFVVPVYNTVESQLRECIDSVLNQTYDNFELILVDDHSSWDCVRPVLTSYEADPRVKVIYRRENGHISAATNDGIAAAKGEFIAFMDCDDFIETNALYFYAEMLNQNPELDFIYSDEDKVTEDGRVYHMPFLKPDWSPHLFFNMMYTNHLAVYRAAIVKAVGGLRTAYNGSQDYDFTLRFMENSANSKVGHIPRILYHWRERKESMAYSVGAKSYAFQAAKNAKLDCIRRNGLNASLEYIDGISQYRMVYHVTGEPKVSIIIPSKDHPDILKLCISSLIEFTDYKNYEIIVVDNGSTEKNRAEISAFLSGVGAKYIYRPAEFNYSAMCNAGARAAAGEFILLLNDDMEFFQPQWMERMLGAAQQKTSGAVGAKLYFPGTTIVQHMGVSNPKGGPLHSFGRMEDAIMFYFGWNRVDFDCIAVTGACLMIEAKKYWEVGGLDESLAVAYNDVKLCFALHRLGYCNFVRNDALAYHHESLSRGFDYINDKSLVRNCNERLGVFADFPEYAARDPYLNPGLDCWAPAAVFKNCFDSVEEMDLSNCEALTMGFVDSVEIDDKIHIKGWGAVPNSGPQYEIQKYLVLADPYGKTYGAKLIPCTRGDVVAVTGDEDYRWSGFECILDKRLVRMDVLPYRLGVMAVGRDGKRYLSWYRESGVIRESRPRPYALGHSRLEGFAPAGGAERVKFYLDECARETHHHRIRGFAFIPGDRHFYYRTTLVLAGEAESIEFEAYPEERVDVAYTFPGERYLYNTGFACYVYDKTLTPGEKYRVYLRLKNVWDNSDIADADTGCVIEV